MTTHIQCKKIIFRNVWEVDTTLEVGGVISPEGLA